MNYREFHEQELAEAIRRLIAFVCDETKVEPETADAYYLCYAITDLERRPLEACELWMAGDLTPEVYGVRLAGYPPWRWDGADWTNYRLCRMQAEGKEVKGHPFFHRPRAVENPELAAGAPPPGEGSR